MLLRVVLENLIGNAWKYTKDRPASVIELGVVLKDAGKVYFVRDNGIGFDTAESEKLFAPFQRLRGAKDSRGFGIGLATVQRIIMRHGGKIWAEGGGGRGATFYFTLPAEGNDASSEN
jgi:signal transduction histidine kinase